MKQLTILAALLAAALAGVPMRAQEVSQRTVIKSVTVGGDGGKMLT